MRLTNSGATVDLCPSGAMITDAAFNVAGQVIRPFFQNPWRNDPRRMDQLTRHLGAEWPCVPFGVPNPPKGLPADWLIAEEAEPWNAHAHGFGAHSDWTLTQVDERKALAEIAYPDTGPIARLKRQVHLATENEVRCRLEIEPRHDAKIAIGLHPVLSLADAAPGAAELRVAGKETAWTFPIDVEPGRSYLQPDQRAVPLSSLRGADGRAVDGRRLPFPCASEDLILLTDPGDTVSLLRPDCGYRVDVRWNADDLPSCLLWLSNRGRTYAPWDSRVCAIGIEPVAAAFDLGELHSRSLTTPLARKGVRTSIMLVQGEIWSTDYSILCVSDC